jgi:limonene-1,2-epoxide hydrolase
MNNNQPFSTVHGSVETKLIVHASHYHALIKDDSALVLSDPIDPNQDPPLMNNNQPFSTVHGSVEAKLIVHAFHDHALIKDDNALVVYYYIEEA